MGREVWAKIRIWRKRKKVLQNASLVKCENQANLIQKRATKRWLKIFKRNAILKSKNFSKHSEKKRPAKTSRFRSLAESNRCIEVLQTCPLPLG